MYMHISEHRSSSNKASTGWHTSSTIKYPWEHSTGRLATSTIIYIWTHSTGWHTASTISISMKTFDRVTYCIND